MKKLLFAIVALVASFTLSSCGGSSPSDVASKSIDLLMDKDYEGYVDQLYFNSDDAEAVKKAKKLYVGLLEAADAKAEKEKTEIKSYELVSEKISEDGKTAKVKFEVTYEDGDKEEQTVDLINVDGEWKVDSGK